MHRKDSLLSLFWGLRFYLFKNNSAVIPHTGVILNFPKLILQHKSIKKCSLNLFNKYIGAYITLNENIWKVVITPVKIRNISICTTSKLDTHNSVWISSKTCLWPIPDTKCQLWKQILNKYFWNSSCDECKCQ